MGRFGELAGKPGDEFDSIACVEKYFSGARRESWGAGVLRTQEGKTAKFAGALFCEEGEWVRVRGEWLDSKFGLQVKVDSFTFEAPVDRDALIDYLAKSSAFRGIGPATARRIVDAAGADFEAALRDPAKLAQEANVELAKIEALAAEWTGRQDLNRTVATLGKFGVSAGRAKRLFDSYGGGVVTIVEQNPYWLVGKVPGMAFRTIDGIALGTGIAKDHEPRLRCGISATIGDEVQEGHTWISFDSLMSLAPNVLKLDTFDDVPKVRDMVERMIAEGDLVARAVRNDLVCVWRKAEWEAEVFVTETILRQGRSESGIFEVPPSAKDALELNPSLNADQAAACANAWRYRLSVITGGAGVGKTYTIDATARGFRSMEKEVVFCAPTGKAAKRMSEAVGCEASTIHRLLDPEFGESEDGEAVFHFKRGDGNALDADVVIVDEVSMVDIRLFAALFKAIDFSRTTVVLVGDHHQLPPIGPGSVLRDLVNREVCPTARLTQVVRQAGVLKHNVSAILDGTIAQAKAPTKSDPVLPPWIVVQKHDAEGAADLVLAMFERLRSKMLPEPGAPDGLRPIDPVWDAQVLTPMHKGPLGTMELNRRMQEAAQAARGVSIPQPKKEGEKTPILPHDKVINSRNNYDLGIMNGATGRVLARYERGQELPVEHARLPGGDAEERVTGLALVVRFDEADEFDVVIRGENLRDISLAYAMTIHKSQGSEFPIAIVVAHRVHSFMHHRGLIYTGVSRSRKTCIIVGDAGGMHACARTVKADQRRTMISLFRSADACREFLGTN